MPTGLFALVPVYRVLGSSVCSVYGVGVRMCGVEDMWEWMYRHA